MSNHHIDKLYLTSYFTGDFKTSEARSCEDHLKKCSDCRTFIDTLASQKESFLSNHPFESINIQKNKNTISFPMRKQWYTIAASLTLIISGMLIYFNSTSTIDYGIKGATGISLMVKGLNNTIEELKNPIYFPGERIQILYSCVDKNNFMLFSIDNNGSLSTFYPQDNDSSTFLQTGALVPLPNSIQLDDYIGKELYLAIFSTKKLYVPHMQEYLKKQFEIAGSVTSMKIKNTKDYETYSLIITKEFIKQ